MNAPVEIALASDSGYFCGLLVTVCSIAKHADPTVKLNFHILDGGLSENQWRMLAVKAGGFHRDLNFNRIIVDENEFKEYPSWNNSRMIYMRLMLPKILDTLAWVIYCDVDFLWLEDIAKLWRMRDKKFYYISVLDPVVGTRLSDEKWARDHSLTCDSSEYCCAGLSFLNLDAFRNHGLFDEAMRLMKKHPPYNDQTIFNIVAEGHKKVLGEKWQCFTQCLTQNHLQEGVVVHYAGEIPWKPIAKTKGFQFLSDTMLIWHRFNAMIHKKSVWWSLRQHFSIGWIFAHRGVCLLFRLPPVNLFVKLFTAFIGHPGVYDVMGIRAKRLTLRQETINE